ncbi:Armadillo-type fold domain containing protein [Cordyceps fumosorosea ARSEF 2679]|uniref:Pre-rRNA-processing protein RIX1 n=1 Tax=Cordyceps fumosorosea (strain ARSEF 2679) TaxID=1081104 RepID=A0A167PA97_CORFA|nr:Armadillo-type fold domain containing protein [Cordyceps fumosorosea ARSEF 2679]OAA56452.1 Armadillo-type fold domain containing protein [Cordyceps fumosorosea ARSEF 2679]
MAPQCPPDLRVLCRKLTTIPPNLLPHQLPALTHNVLRCKDVLSAQHDAKVKEDASISALVHKFKRSITTLLEGRSREGRFAAVVLIKAVVDVGGWEILRTAGPWVNGLLSIVQKGDPIASKELAIIVITRIYILIQPYQTLIREIATPTIPAFGAACVQLLKAHSSTPPHVSETICAALHTLIPHHPATLRPLSSQLRTAVRPYLAPTCSDTLHVPASLTRAARRLVISMHFVAAKSSGSDEWGKLVDSILRDLHQTADQVLRAVDEAWQPTSGYDRNRVSTDGEPAGGDESSPEQLPSWAGVTAGAERLAGLFSYLEETLNCSTKSPVTVPIGAYMDAVCRMCVIARLSPKTQTWDQALDTNSGVGRDEKDELWSVVPSLHIAALSLLRTMVQRLYRDMIPLVPEAIDHLVRVVKSGMSIPNIRTAGYQVLDQLLHIAGSTMPKTTVDMLDPILGACCRDLQQDAGILKPAEKPASSGKDATAAKKNGGSVAIANVDLFLARPDAAAASSFPAAGLGLEPAHKHAATQLLATLPSSLPQAHLKPTMRGLLDKTAIITADRDAMLASVLNPYKDQRGRLYPSILPYLCRRYPEDQGLEILRSNLRTSGINGSGEMFATFQEVEEEQQEEDDADVDEEMVDDDADVAATDTDPAVATSGAGLSRLGSLASLPKKSSVEVPQDNPFAARNGAADNGFAAATSSDSPPKRKHDGEDEPAAPAKRLEVERPAELPKAKAAAAKPKEEDADDDDDSDVSVHLNMELEDDEDDDE